MASLAAQKAAPSSSRGIDVVFLGANLFPATSKEQVGVVEAVERALT